MHLPATEVHGIDQLVAAEVQRVLPSLVAAEVSRALAGMQMQPPAQHAKRISANDMRVLDVLLPVMWRAAGVSTFAIAELLTHAGLHAELAEAIEGATGRPLADAAKALGKLFRRAAGVTVAGLQVHRIGVSGGVALWALGVRPVAEMGLRGFQTTTKPKLVETRQGRSSTKAAP